MKWVILIPFLIFYNSYPQDRKPNDSTNYILLKDSSRVYSNQVNYIPGNNYIIADSIAFPIQQVLSFQNESGYFSQVYFSPVKSVRYSNQKFLLRKNVGKINTYSKSFDKGAKYYQMGTDPIMEISYKSLKYSFKDDDQNLELIKSIYNKNSGLLYAILGGALILTGVIKMEDCSDLSTQSSFFGSPNCESRNLGSGVLIGLGFGVIIIGTSTKSTERNRRYLNFFNTYNSQFD